MLYKDAKNTGNASGEEALRQILFFVMPLPFLRIFKEMVHLKKKGEKGRGQKR